MKRIRWGLLALVLACGPEDEDDKSAVDSDSTGTNTAPLTDTDAAVSDADPTDTAPSSGLTAQITPVIDTFEYGMPGAIYGTVEDPSYQPYQLTATWISSLDGPIVTVAPDQGGLVTLDASLLSAGWHDITLDVSNPAGAHAIDTKPIAVCKWSDPESFSADITGAGWQIYGDAFWDAGGWLEMTDNLQYREGQIYYLEKKVPAGDLNIDFKIWTGAGINSGADGFAVSIVNVDSVEDLTPIIMAANDGGCLGYGIAGSGECDSAMVVDAFHIEFDTWYNSYPQNDPTTENHVAITLDGEPGVHYLWGAIPTIEDSQWHDVSVQTQGDSVLVTIDGFEAIKGDIPDLNFEGGYLGFSGTTGWATNYHRFDDLQIRDECLVPTK